MKESDLFIPIKTYLEHQGYSVHSEVKNCDIVAKKDEEIIIIELKKNFSVDLLIQAVKRKEITHSVYVAIPVCQGKRVPNNFSGIKRLLRRLETGLILVYLMKTKTKIEIVLHPKEYNLRRQHKKRVQIIKEISGRFKEFNKGGSPSTVERITAYKQKSIKIAYLLNQHNESSPKQLINSGADNNAAQMLNQNIYGWFDKVKRGIYKLNTAGMKVLKEYPDLIEIFKSP